MSTPPDQRNHRPAAPAPAPSTRGPATSGHGGVLAAAGAAIAILTVAAGFVAVLVSWLFLNGSHPYPDPRLTPANAVAPTAVAVLGCALAAVLAARAAQHGARRAAVTTVVVTTCCFLVVLAFSWIPVISDTNDPRYAAPRIANNTSSDIYLYFGDSPHGTPWAKVPPNGSVTVADTDLRPDGCTRAPTTVVGSGGAPYGTRISMCTGAVWEVTGTPIGKLPGDLTDTP